jgi:hypothetical protein
LPIRNSEPVFSALNTTTKRISTCRQPTCYYFGEKRGEEEKFFEHWLPTEVIQVEVASMDVGALEEQLKSSDATASQWFSWVTPWI